MELAGLDTTDVLAKEFQYHRSCYRENTRKDKSKEEKGNKLRQESFDSLKIFVKEHIIERGEIIKVSQLVDHYEEKQKQRNLEIKGANNRLVKARLQNAFGNEIAFFKKTETSCELVFSNEATGSSNTLQYQSSEEKVKEVALLIKDEIKVQNLPFAKWPPHADQLKQENVIIPNLLEMFLTALLTTKKSSERVARLVKSIGQDLVYNSSSGNVKTVKHTQVGLFTKRKTGSKLMINTLNKLGHSISYSETNRVETAFAEQESQNKTCASYVPTGVRPSVFATFVYDNNDHNPETISGTSMHCTNGIIIQLQPAVIEESNLPVFTDESLLPKSKRRSFIPISNDLEPYYSVERSNPDTLPGIENDQNLLDALLSKKADFIWTISRKQASSLQMNPLPGWTGFHNLSSSDDNNPCHAVFYLPAIDKSPTEMSTIQEVLKQIKLKSEAMGLDCADAVFDHAIYSKALEVVTDPKNKNFKNFINLRMGGFHACLTFIAVIGKRFSDAGLRDIIVEAELVGSGSIDGVLRGKQYNRAMRAIKIVYEALQRLKFEAFEAWIQSENKLDILDGFIESNELSRLIKKIDSETMVATMNKSDAIFNLYEEFENWINEGNLGPLAIFWQSFIEMVQTLLDYIKSMRTGNWSLHLQSMEQMLQWFHAYDHVNYARHFTYCWSSQQKLAEKHPSIHEEFLKGNFCCKRVPGKFNMLPPDQVIEQTVNKEQKGPGGIIGFSTSEGTMQRWVLTSHLTAAISSDLKESLDIDTIKSTPKDLGKKRRLLDETVVSTCQNVIASWTNPFVKNVQLVSLSSGIAATDEVLNDLLSASAIGAKQLKEFVTSRIETSNVKFHDPIKKNKLKTFSSLSKKITVKVKERMMTIKADRQTFARLMVIQKSRCVHLKDVLCYELSSVPLSLANPDGSLAKTTKVNLFHSLEPLIPMISVCSPNSPVIFDGMVLLQKIPPNLKTFGEISDYLLKKILSGSANTAYFVTDHYLPHSIKTMERNRRSMVGTIRVIPKRRDQPKPKQFQRFLTNAENKLDLIKFLVSEWSTNDRHVAVFKDKIIFITVEDKAFSIKVSRGSMKIDPVPELESQQEEADTKMFLCAAHASSWGYESVKIVTVDSDVAILSIYYQKRLDLSIYLEMGTGTKTKLFDIKNNEIDDDLQEVLPSLHALTGCDSTSCFNGVGKVKSKTILMSDERFVAAAKLLGECDEVSNDVEGIIEEYVCKLYGSSLTSVNQTRYQLFTSLKKTPDPNR